MKVEDPHLAELSSVPGVLNQKVRSPPAQAVPYFGGQGDIAGGPVGIARVCDHTTQTGEVVVFIFNRGLEPVFTVFIDNQAALIELMLIPEADPGCKGEVFTA